MGSEHWEGGWGGGFLPDPILVAVSSHSSAPSVYTLPDFYLLMLAECWFLGGLSVLTQLEPCIRKRSEMSSYPCLHPAEAAESLAAEMSFGDPALALVLRVKRSCFSFRLQYHLFSFGCSSRRSLCPAAAWRMDVVQPQHPPPRAGARDALLHVQNLNWRERGAFPVSDWGGLRWRSCSCWCVPCHPVGTGAGWDQGSARLQSVEPTRIPAICKTLPGAMGISA